MLPRREADLAHQLANIGDLDTLLGHPLCGPSWEGFVVEHTLARLPTSAKPALSRGFHAGFADVGATAGFAVIPAGERFPLGKKIDAIPLRQWLAMIDDIA